MESFDLIWKLVATIVSVTSIILNIIIGVKKGKLKTTLNLTEEELNSAMDSLTQTTEDLKISNKLVNVSNVLMELVQNAESFKNYTGTEKLNYVLTKYQLYCLQNSLNYNEDCAKTEIEKIIDVTKNVNTKTCKCEGSEVNQ